MGAGGCPRTLKGVSGKSLINQIQGEIEDLLLLNRARVAGGRNFWEEDSCTKEPCSHGDDGLICTHPAQCYNGVSAACRLDTPHVDAATDKAKKRM